MPILIGDTTDQITSLLKSLHLIPISQHNTTKQNEISYINGLQDPTWFHSCLPFWLFHLPFFCFLSIIQPVTCCYTFSYLRAFSLTHLSAWMSLPLRYPLGFPPHLLRSLLKHRLTERLSLAILSKEVPHSYSLTFYSHTSITSYRTYHPLLYVSLLSLSPNQTINFMSLDFVCGLYSQHVEWYLR